MATISEVLVTDTIEEGRVKLNTSIDNVNDEAIASTAALTAHKAADDHAATYAGLAHTHTGTYAEADEVVALTGDQDVDGVKSFLDPLVIKNGAAGVELKTAAGAPVAKFIGVVAGADTMVALYAYSAEQAQYVQMMRAYPDDESADFPFVDLYCRGKLLATVEHVQDRIRSGFFHKELSIGVATLADGTTYYVEDARGGALLIPIPNGATLRNVAYNYRTAAAIGDDQNRIAVPIVFTDGGYRWLYVRAVFTNSTNSIALSIGAARWVTGVESITWTIVDTISDGDFATGNPVTLYVGLEFSL